MNASEIPDPFARARQKTGCAHIDDQDELVAMLLKLDELRKAAKDWETFTSFDIPGRIVVPSEEHIRDIRQIPIELDPPDHKQFRTPLEKWFKRPIEASYSQQLKQIIALMVEQAIDKDSIEIIHDFALTLQSRALTLLLNVPLEESVKWISWGTHVFRSEGNSLDNEKADQLYDYIDEQIEKAVSHPGSDIYSELLRTQIEGRSLTKEEIKGIMLLTFAGGRDTVINSVTNTIAYLADHPKSLIAIQNDSTMINRAVEELLRYFSPLTHIGRVASEDTEVGGLLINKDSRISLCWASANRDDNIFEHPNEVNLNRAVNPHVAFGFGIHRCLGATHARQILRILLMVIAEKVESIQILSFEENIEDWGEFKRKVGFERLEVRFKAKR